MAASSLKLIFRGEIFRLPSASALLIRLKIGIFKIYMLKALACPQAHSPKLESVVLMGWKKLISSFRPHSLAPK